MNAVNHTTPSDEADLDAFMDDGMRKDLGLRKEDLQVGLEVARNHMRRGAPQDALKIYVGLILCEPTNIDFQVGLANCALQLGEDHLALQSASAVVALAPRDARGYYLSGRACLGLGYLAEAEEDFHEAFAHARDARNVTIAEEAQRLLRSISAASPRASATA